MKTLILGFRDYEVQGRRLAAALGRPFALVDLHRFPDGESKVTLPAELPERLVFCRSLHRPNDKLIELLLAAKTARALGARQIALAAPYLCYMRQDTAFEPGQAVSQRIVGCFLADLFDAVITVDPHLHRIDKLSEAIPGIQAAALSCAGVMGDFLKSYGGNPLLVGPDSESEQWVRAVAIYSGLDYIIAHKVRRGDREVAIHIPEADYRDRPVVLVDDMVSTGGTVITAATELKIRGAGPIACLVTHALYGDEAAQQMHAAGIERIWSSDSIAHASNAVTLTPVLAAGVAALD